jgi:hypothetical protein
MNAMIAILAIAAVVGLGLLAVFVMLLIGMRTEGSHMSPSSAPHTRTGTAARRLLGVYVHREPKRSRTSPTTEWGGDFDYPQSPNQPRRAPLRMRRPGRGRLADMP